MTRKILLLVLATIMLYAFSPAAYAEWVWTPETGWVNRKKVERRNLNQIYADAVDAFSKELYREAYGDFNYIATYFTETQLHEPSLFYSAECYYHLGRYNGAFKIFERFLTQYPGTKRINETVSRLHEIGKAFLDGRRLDQSVLAASIRLWPSRKTGIDILRHVVENYPFTENTDAVQHTIAAYYFEKGDFADAEIEYKRLVEMYHLSSWRETAFFMIPVCRMKTYRGRTYTQEMLEEAREAFWNYLAAYPKGEFVASANAYLAELKESDAERHVNIARYYLKTGERESAIVYFKFVVENFQDTSWAQKAAESLQTLKGKER